ncbi:MAG: hypothetical protein JKY31_13905 [Rhodobacteraceae bacterium]|nr:hypothetical protein [Paracoccaceae bacterium]
MTEPALKSAPEYEAVNAMHQKTVKDALGPWSLRQLETYQTEFLAGFRAENHIQGLEDGFFEAQHCLRTKITGWIRTDIGGMRQWIKSSSTTFLNQTFKHFLLPV